MNESGPACELCALISARIEDCPREDVAGVYVKRGMNLYCPDCGRFWEGSEAELVEAAQYTPRTTQIQRAELLKAVLEQTTGIGHQLLREVLMDLDAAERSLSKTRTPVIFEMETQDPDDFMTLLWLADHPKVDLLGVMVTPGGHDQCALVRWGLNHCGREDVPIGTYHGAAWWKTLDGQKPRVSTFHYKVYSDEAPAWKLSKNAVHYGPALVSRLVRAHPDTTYLVGSPPKTLAQAFRMDSELRIWRWIQQGGFAGDNLVAEEDRLEKFKGRTTCPSFNVGGAWKQTLELCDLGNERLSLKRFVSKNVCHGVIWDAELQTRLKQHLVAPFVGPTKYAQIPGGEVSLPSPPPADWMQAIRPGLRTMLHRLDTYLRDKGKAKAMHDLVAAACVLDEQVCRWSPEVETYRVKGEWGARPQEGTRTKISVGFDLDRFVKVLAGN